MKTRKIKIPAGLNHHAINAWWYIGETAKTFVGKERADYEFMCLVRDMLNAYPDEYEFYLAAERGEV